MKKKLFPLMLLIIATVVVPSCKKKNNDPAPNPTPQTNGGPAITSSFYFQAKIDGNWITLQDGVNGFASGTMGGNYGTSVNQEEQAALITNYGLGQFACFFILKTFPGTVTGADYESMFSVNSYNYGINKDLPNGIDGAGIAYTDASGIDWRSDYGTANQTGSTFNIVEHIVNTDGYSHKISKATFSCKLYDGNGNSKTVTNGVLRGRSIIY